MVASEQDRATRSVKLLSHKRFIPWRLTRADSYDAIAGALRAWSTMAQGGELDRHQRQRYNALRAHLEATNRVVDYDRSRGFELVPRDPAVDDPDLPIRRPV